MTKLARDKAKFKVCLTGWKMKKETTRDGKKLS